MSQPPTIKPSVCQCQQQNTYCDVFIIWFLAKGSTVWEARVTNAVLGRWYDAAAKALPTPTAFLTPFPLKVSWGLSHKNLTSTKIHKSVFGKKESYKKKISVFLKTYLRVLHEDGFLWDLPQIRNCSQCWELTNIRSDPSIGISANIDEAQGNGARWAGAKAVALKRTSPGQISCTGSPRAAWHWLFVGDDGLRGCDLSWEEGGRTFTKRL